MCLCHKKYALTVPDISSYTAILPFAVVDVLQGEKRHGEEG